MHVTVVGSGDAFGSGGRFQICIALAADPAAAPTVLLDCGATSLTALRQQHIDPNVIEAVLVSHLHGDHFGGLPFLVLDGQFRRRTRDLTVLGPPGTRVRLEQAMEALFPGSSGVARRFAVHVVEHTDRRPLELGALRVTPYEVRHASGAPAYALRVEAPDASVAYSGDTEGPTRCWTPPTGSSCSCVRATARPRSAGTSTWTPSPVTATGSPAGSWCSPIFPRPRWQRN